MPEPLRIGWSEPTRLELRYTGNLKGDLQALPYLATLIKNERRAHPEMIMVDTGDFSGKGQTAQAMVEVMNHLHFDAVVPGQAEAKNAANLRRLAGEAVFPLLAANWRGPQGVVQPRTLLKRGGVDVALVGLAWPEPPSGWELVPPEEAIQEALAGIDTDQTVVIVISQLGFTADRTLAMRVPDVQVVLEGVPYPGFSEVTEIGESLVVPAVPGGKALGSLGLDLSGALTVGEGGGEGTP